jgi:DNA-binding MarR family transcriptional regulator
VLNTLAEVGEDNIGTIAELSAYERSYMSRVVERMVAEGYLERASTATDKRYTLVRLTELGRERWQAAMPLVAAAMDNAVAGLTADRLRDLVAALRTVERNVTYPDAVKLAPVRAAPPRTDRRRRA